MRTLLVQRNGAFDDSVEPGELAAALAGTDTTVWLDICDPDDGDIRLLRDYFGFHPLAIEDALRSHERPKVDTYGVKDGPVLVGQQQQQHQHTQASRQGRYYFIVFYAASYAENHDDIELQPANLFIGANYLVTVHHDNFRHIDETMARWQVPDSPLGSRVGALVHALLDAMVDDYFPLMDQVADRIETLEDAIFVHFDQRAIQTIFGLKKGLLAMRRVAGPERDVINVLLRQQLPIFNSEDMAYLQDVYDHIVRVTDNVDTYRDLLSSALDSFLSLQSNNLNQIMKILTAASIVLMTDALIAGIYGMNFHFMPELAWPFGYAWALLLMLGCSLGLMGFFRFKHWL